MPPREQDLAGALGGGEPTPARRLGHGKTGGQLNLSPAENKQLAGKTAENPSVAYAPGIDEGASAGVLIPFEAMIRVAVIVFLAFPVGVAPITITSWQTLKSNCADGTVGRLPNFVMESTPTVITVPSVAVTVHMLAMIVLTVLRNAAATIGRA